MKIKVDLDKRVCPLRTDMGYCGAMEWLHDCDDKQIRCGYDYPERAPKECPLRKGSIVLESINGGKR